MLCGYLKQTCKSITVEELINLLQLCKNKKATIKVNGISSFYIHFEQDGHYIDLTKQALSDQYGENGAGNTCTSCRLCDKTTGACKCNGEGCLNAESMIDTEKYNDLGSEKTNDDTDTKSEEDTAVFQVPLMTSEENKNKRSYDLSMLSINGNGSENSTTPEVYNYTKNEAPNIDDPNVKIISPVLERNILEEEALKNAKPLDSVIKKAIKDSITDVLETMINSIKG